MDYQPFDITFRDDYEDEAIESENEKYLNAKSQRIIQLIEAEYNKRVVNEKKTDFELKTKIAIGKPGTIDGFCQSTLPEESTQKEYARFPLDRQKEIVMDFSKEMAKKIGSNHRLSKYQLIANKIEFKGPWVNKIENLETSSCFYAMGCLSCKVTKYCKKKSKDFDHCQLIVVCKPINKATRLIN